MLDFCLARSMLRFAFNPERAAQEMAGHIRRLGYSRVRPSLEALDAQYAFEPSVRELITLLRYEEWTWRYSSKPGFLLFGFCDGAQKEFVPRGFYCTEEENGDVFMFRVPGKSTLGVGGPCEDPVRRYFALPSYERVLKEGKLFCASFASRVVQAFPFVGKPCRSSVTSGAERQAASWVSKRERKLREAEEAKIAV